MQCEGGRRSTPSDSRGPQKTGLYVNQEIMAELGASDNIRDNVVGPNVSLCCYNIYLKKICFALSQAGIKLYGAYCTLV